MIDDMRYPKMRRWWLFDMHSTDKDSEDAGSNKPNTSKTDCHRDVG